MDKENTQPTDDNAVSQETPSTPPKQEQQPIPNTLRDESSPTTPYGPLIAVIIIVVLLLVAGFYFFGERLDQRAPQETTEDDVQTQMLEQQGNSDEISDIEEDLNNTSLENIDQELDQIDQELQAQ